VTTMVIEPSGELGSRRVAIALPACFAMTDDEFFEFCQINDDFRIERTVRGEILVTPLAGFETSVRNVWITTQLNVWAEKDGTGVATGSSAGFMLPNDSVRAPDAAWVKRSRLATLSAEQKRKFIPLCPRLRG